MGDLLVNMAQFILKIKIGNEAMQTLPDIASALENVCTVLSGIDNIDDAELYGPVRIHDINGNTVGSWQVK